LFHFPCEKEDNFNSYSIRYVTPEPNNNPARSAFIKSIVKLPYALREDPEILANGSLSGQDWHMCEIKENPVSFFFLSFI